MPPPRHDPSPVQVWIPQLSRPDNSNRANHSGLSPHFTVPYYQNASFCIFLMSAWELNAPGRVYGLAKPRRSDMWISICAMTLATAISCCVAAMLMQPKDDRATLGR